MTSWPGALLSDTRPLKKFNTFRELRRRTPFDATAPCSQFTSVGLILLRLARFAANKAVGSGGPFSFLLNS